MPADDQAPATCPTCGGPVKVELMPVHPANRTQLQMIGFDPDKPVETYRTLADPARLRAMTELLGEMSSWLAPDCEPVLWFDAFRKWQAKARALLPPKEAP